MWPSGLTHSELKEWPAEHWSRLAQFCHDQAGRSFYRRPTGYRRSRAWIERQKEQARLTNKGGATFAETIHLLTNAEAVISVNTGVLHLAAALGLPTVGLHGPSNEKRWGAVGDCVCNLAVPPPQGGYLNLGFEYPADAATRPGLETITPSEVFQALSDLLGLTPCARQKTELAVA